MLLFRIASILVLFSRIAFVRGVPSYTLILGGLPALWSFANVATAASLILVSLTLIATVYAEQSKRQFDLASWTILPLCVLVDVFTGYPIRVLIYPFPE